MLKTLSLVTVGATVMALGTVTQAEAAVVWNWSFGGTEAGTFETNGEFSDTADPFTFTIDPASFEVTSSSEPSLIGDDFTARTQPDVGFQWDGTQATQFFRASGGFTNGANLYSSDSNLGYGFFPGNSFLFEGDGFTLVSGAETLTPVDPNAAAVPEPFTILGSATALGFGALFKRQNSKKQKNKDNN